MMEFLDNTTIRCVEDYTHLGLPVEAEAMLLIEVDGRRAVVDEDALSIAEICRKFSATAVNVARDNAESIRLKTARKAALTKMLALT